ncbi:MAG: sigma-70 family RNA polymerase sigma factor [Polyangiales bacterium]
MSVKAHLRLLPPPAAAPVSREIVSIDDLFREFAPVVARLGLRMLGRPHEVDDLVQDVFLDAHLGQAALRDPSALRSWVYTIAIRHVRRRLRKRKLRQVVGLDEVSDYSRLTAREASAEERAVLAAVYRTLDRIPVEARIAWQLRYVEGETLPRVAELCGCSRATAHRRIVAAQVAIDEEMGDG